jgi:hypothetical protein
LWRQNHTKRVPRLAFRVILSANFGLERAIRDRGGRSEVVHFLHATPETLVPYMIAIAAQTFANPEALRLMRRDCMREHVLLEGRVVVTWTKGRSNRPQRRSFLRDKSFSVPNLIERVLALTGCRSSRMRGLASASCCF